MVTGLAKHPTHIRFDEYELVMPNHKDIKAEWAKLQRYMNVKLGLDT